MTVLTPFLDSLFRAAMLSPAFTSPPSLPTVTKTRGVGETPGYRLWDYIVSRWLAVAFGVGVEKWKYNRKFLHCPRFYLEEHSEHSYGAIAIRQKKMEPCKTSAGA